MTEDGRTEYCVEVRMVKDDEQVPWIEMSDGRFLFRTFACMKMIELKEEHPEFDWRVSPV